MALSDNDFQSLLSKLGYMPSTKMQPVASVQPEQMATDEQGQTATSDDTTLSQPISSAPNMSVDPDVRLQQLLTGKEKPVSDADHKLLQDYLSKNPDDNTLASTQPTSAPATDDLSNSGASPMAQAELAASGANNLQTTGDAGTNSTPAPATPPPVDAAKSPSSAAVTPNAPMPPVEPPMSPVASTNPLDAASVNDKAIQDAQKQAQVKQLIGNVGEGLGTFAAEAGGKKFDPGFYRELESQSQQPVKDIETRRNEMIKNLQTAGMMSDLAVKNMSAQQQQQMNDPNSSASKGYKRLIEHYEPWLSKDANWQNMSGQQALEATKYLETESKLLNSKANMQFNQNVKQSAVDQKQTNKTNDDFMKFGKQVQGSIASSRGDFGKNSNVIRQAGQLDQLIAQIKAQPGGADKRQYFELARQLDGMLSSGQGTITGTKELMPETAQKQYGGLKEWLTSSPQASGLEDFVKRAEDTIKREKNYAVDRNAQTIAKMAPGFSHLKKADTSRWNEVLNSQGLQTDEQGNITGMQTPQELTRTPAVSTPAAPTTAPAASAGATPSQTSDRVEIITSKGDHISLPRANLDAARKRDPNLQVVE